MTHRHFSLQLVTELEQRVAQRTAELSRTTLQLQQEMAERRQAEERTRLLQDELTHLTRMTTMGEMASGFAHELNQPLMAIVGFTKSCLRHMRSGKAPKEELMTMLEDAAAEALRAGEIIRRLRRLVYRREPHRSRMPVNEAILEVAALLESEMILQEIRLHLELAQSLPFIFADRIQIQQVLLNLVRNAVEAMSQVDVEERELMIQTESGDSGMVEVRISDHGPGACGEELERLFQPFFTTKPHGMGLGLSISRSIIEAHGGRLTAEPLCGGGLMFRFTLPMEGEGGEDGAMGR